MTLKTKTKDLSKILEQLEATLDYDDGTYFSKFYSKVVAGYITSADYVGEITQDRVESVTYWLTYLGTELEEQSEEATEQTRVDTAELFRKCLPYALGGLGVGTVAVLTVLLFRSRRALRQLQEEPEDELEHEEETT